MASFSASSASSALILFPLGFEHSFENQGVLCRIVTSLVNPFVDPALGPCVDSVLGLFVDPALDPCVDSVLGPCVDPRCALA